MRRLLVVLFALLALPLVAAAPSDLAVKPRVMVYPFSASASTIDREASSRLATIIAQQMADSKLVVVVPAPPGTERKDYLTTARQSDADFYISGYISPLGNGVSVVEQVVGTDSGIIIFSNTAQLQTYNDASGQGDQLAAAIARYANRNLVAPPAAPQPSTSPTPAPETNQANLGGLFKRKKRGTAAAAASPKPTAAPTTIPVAAARNVTPAPAAAPPQPRVLSHVTSPAAAGTLGIALGGGNADAALRETVASRLLAEAEKAGRHAVRVETTLDAVRSGGQTVCSANHVGEVAVATLDVAADQQYLGHNAHLDLAVFDCAGRVTWHKAYDDSAGGRTSAQLAAERVADKAIGAYLHPPRKR